MKRGPSSAFESPTFEQDVSIRVDEAIGAASISPSGRDVILASRNGLYIIDLDSPYSPPRHIVHRSPWEVADVQWSPFACRDYWVVTTSNQKALVFNLELSTRTPHAPIEYVLHAHKRAITDINFSAHHPDILATCAVDSFVHCWDLRQPVAPALSFGQDSGVKYATKPFAMFADWDAGATQVKWNRQDANVIASSHDRYLRLWDRRKGAIPFKTIEAHSTKIYGIDWNRIKTSGILTCSLDHTIKVWDYMQSDDDNIEPERVFRTPFPVWRARHTPFGWGVLAMPQRGDFDLHLYDRRLSDGVERDDAAKPVYSFEGHSDHVKEFLWRSRGDVTGGIDNRDFQLVSWGADRNLHLHTISPDTLKAVGYEKGKEVHRKLTFTRQGAVYKTFREEPKQKRSDKESKEKGPGNQGGLSSLLQGTGMNKAAIRITQGFQERGYMTSSASIQTRVNTRKVINPIAWMEGVKIGKRENGMYAKYGTRDNILPPAHQWNWDAPEGLFDEIKHVGTKFRKVQFESVDTTHRTATIALYGPWGPDSKAVFVRISLKFPAAYPRSATPQYKIEKTTSAIAEETLQKMNAEIKEIARYYQSKRRGCLEAIIGYLLGERGLEESIGYLSDGDLVGSGLDSQVEESSSDEEDGLGADFDGPQNPDMEMSGTDILGPSNANANVPLPKECGASWGNNGRLVCFFPPKPESKPLFTLAALGNTERFSRSQRIFETFGRLHPLSPELGRKMSSAIEEAGESSDHESWATSSSTSSSESSEGIGAIASGFAPPVAWRGNRLRLHRSSQPSSAGYATNKTNEPKPKSIIRLHDFGELLPSKRKLAERYKIFGTGSEVCTHNAEVALSFGYRDLADIWQFCSLILSNEVPLEVMPQSYRKEQILVLARRALVRIKRKDSGLDLAFDEADSVSNPKLTGHVKWGHHPFAGRWLIPALFDYFERLADVQMLAMLTCIFHEPAANQGVDNAIVNRYMSQGLPMSMEAPAFSLDYFSSQDAAWSLFKPPPSAPSTPGIPIVHTLSKEINPWDKLSERKLDTYGSQGSSDGPWGSDNVHSDPLTPYSTGTTPPAHSRTPNYRNSAVPSLSTSPEHHHIRKSPSNLANALASLSRPFSTTASSSPPAAQKRDNDGELSTSAPTSSITWGANTFYSSASTVSGLIRSKTQSSDRLRQSRQQLQAGDGGSDEDDGDSDASDDSHLEILLAKEAEKAAAVKITLKNQDQFDDEACYSEPLLDPSKDWLYRGYRHRYAELLGRWNLPVQRAQVMKFDGLASYWNPLLQHEESVETQPLKNLPSEEESHIKILPIALAPLSEQIEQHVSRSQLNPQASPFVPGSQKNSPVGLYPVDAAVSDGSRTSLNPYHSNTLGSEATRRSVASTRDISRSAETHGKPDPRTCAVCWRSIWGTYYLCSFCNDAVHANCWSGYVCPDFLATQDKRSMKERADGPKDPDAAWWIEMGTEYF